MSRTAQQIRADFIAFFRDRHGHAFAPSSPVVPYDDPTLLFTNAGMNQFKDVFLGQGRRDYVRAVNSQKCIRAGGKHNDLEDVGRDHYHHTFFEMLGNWSFGDYFKAEAIEWAWTLLVDEWRLDPERLHVTVFGGDEADGLPADEEAAELWRRFVPEERIRRFGRKDNFWEMGETGPCGPCSEIHYDGTPDGSGGPLVNLGDPRVIEIWNLVFIQFDRGDDGRLTPLPAQHVDTGMGLERVVRVMQGKESNYDTDLWTPIFEAIRAESGAPAYGGTMESPVDVAYRVIADHVRCLTVALTDGAAPSSDGRGYVLRRILRRAARHARQTLGVEGPLLCRLVPAVVATLGEAFPELGKSPGAVATMIREEEEAFLRTLDRGIALFDEAASRVGTSGTIGAEDAFRLHDTFGFPIDLTRVMAEERGLTVDEAGYEAAMEAARERSRGGGDGEQRMSLPAAALEQLRQLGVPATADGAKYVGKPVTATIRAIWNGHDFDESVGIGKRVALILDRTCFYAEAGGQVADHGAIEHVGTQGSGRFLVEDVVAVGGYVLHVGQSRGGSLAVDDRVEAAVERQRRDHVAVHHTTTHLLNHALRATLGEGIDQKGSLVAPDRLRFDFSHGHAMSPEELAAVERLVAEAIERDLPVDAKELPLDRAMAIEGVRAVFGERYPDPVRVVSIGASVAELDAQPGDARWRDLSVEFCGGTHLNSTGAAKRFVILSESALASGVRRIAAVAGVPAIAAGMAAEGLLASIAAAASLAGEELVASFDVLQGEFERIPIGAVARHEIAPKMEALRERVRGVRKSAEKAARGEATEAARRIAEEFEGPIVVASIDGADKDVLLSALDVIRAKRPEAAAMLLAPNEAEGKVAIAAIVPKPLIGQGLKAGDWVREAAKACGGNGGGRPDMAQAGGKEPEKLLDAIRAARAFATGILGVPK